MKRFFALMLAVLLLCQVPLALAGTIWYCPVCGRQNDNNFCPADGTPRPSDYDSGNDSYTFSEPVNSYTQYAYVIGTLNDKLATRTGPGTQYDEPGTFLSRGSQVTVLSKAYDQRNGIWWVQVEFTASGSAYRAYTGVKRFTGLNLSLIPEERVIGACVVSQSVTGYYGPGYNYRAISKKVPGGVRCDIYGYAFGEEGDFLLIEFFDQNQNRSRRAWINEWNADDFEMYYGL